MTSRAEALYFASPVWLQNVLVSAMGYKLYRRRYTGMYHELRELVRESREWSEAKKADYQSERLHEMVKHCRQNIPYYQKLFSEYGIHENHITSLKDLQKIPTLDKQTVQQRAAEFRDPRQKPYMIQHTSGSTGTPLALQVNETTYKLAMALLVDHEEYHGVNFGAPRATFAGRMIQRPDSMKPPFYRFNRAENQRIYSSYHLNNKTFSDYKRDLEVFSPEEIIGYPSAISEIASHYLRAGIKPTFKPKAIVTNSETLIDWQREKIETAFDSTVFDYYGTAEYVIFAGQDKTGQYQVNPIIGLAEKNSPRSSADSSEIISTTLTNTTMPLLRYETNDLIISENNKNVRDQFINRFASVLGRIDDYIETHDQRRIGRLDHILKGISNVVEAQLEQLPTFDLVVHIVPTENYQEYQEDEIRENLKQRIGTGLRIDFAYTDRIPRSKNGKFKSVISRRSNLND